MPLRTTKFLKSHFQLVFIFLIAFLLPSVSTKLLAQKIKYADVHEVIKKKETVTSKKYLQEFIEQSPNHALAMYQLAKILETELRQMNLFERVDFKRKYKTVLNLYQVAEALATKKEASKNKPYYQEIFGTKKVTASVLKFTYQQQVTRFMAFHDTAQNIISKTELIKYYYRKQEADFDSIVRKFDRYPDIYFSTDDVLINLLNEMVSLSDNISASIIQIDELVVAHFPNSLPKRYIFQEFNDFNAQKVAALAFKEKRINLYNYGEWAGNIIQFIRNEILPLRKNILEADAKLTALVNSYYMDNPILSHIDYYDASPLIFKLFQLDGNSLAAKVLMYKKLKADYLSRIMDNEFDFTQDSGKVVKNVIESSREVLKNIKVEPESYKNYRGYFNKVFEGEEGLKQYLQREEIFWDSEFQSLKAGAIAGNGKGVKTFENFNESTASTQVNSIGNIASAKIDLDVKVVNKDSLIAFGGYAVEGTFPLENNKWLALGLAPSEFSGKKDVFAAKVDTQENVFWLRKFMHVQEGNAYDLAIHEMVTNEAGQVFMLLKASFSKKVVNRLVGIDSKGNLLLDEEISMESMPRLLLYLEETNKLLMVLKGKYPKDNADQFEQSHFIEMNRAGLQTGELSVGIKGQFATYAKVGEGYAVVFNILTYQSGNNQFLNSKAIINGGYNPLVFHFNKQGQMVEVIPVLSEQPIFVNDALVNDEGKLILKGKKGVAAMQDPTLPNGNDWEELVQLRDKS